MEEVLKRYYKGETTLAEERELRSAWQRGELPGEPILGLRDGRADPFIQGDLHNDTPSGYTTVG